MIQDFPSKKKSAIDDQLNKDVFRGDFLENDDGRSSIVEIINDQSGATIRPRNSYELANI